MYNLCEKMNVNHHKCGKWVVAVNETEMEQLLHLERNGRQSGVEELRMLSKQEIVSQAESHLKASGVLLSPESGIVDAHSFIQALETLSRNRGCEIALQHTLSRMERRAMSYKLTLLAPDQEEMEIESETVVNCAGLNSDRVAEMLLKERLPMDYRLYQSKGFYFAYRGPNLLDSNRLIYPIPEKGVRTLGVHLTIDLNHNIKFGPDKHYMARTDPPNYNFPEDPAELDRIKKRFLQSIQAYFPKIQHENLHPDYSGVRPTRASETDTAFKVGCAGPCLFDEIQCFFLQDFIINEEGPLGFPGLVNLVGIESPGLTASLAIAEYTAALLGYKALDADLS